MLIFLHFLPPFTNVSNKRASFARSQKKAKKKCPKKGCCSLRKKVKERDLHDFVDVAKTREGLEVKCHPDLSPRKSTFIGFF